MRRSSSLGSVAKGSTGPTGPRVSMGQGSASRILTSVTRTAKSRISTVRTPVSAYSGSAVKQRRSSSLPRLSTGSACGANREKKDLASLQDKNFMKKSVMRVVKFLDMYHFSPPLAAKSLHIPTRKDFVRIFEFICSFLMNPDWQLGMKFEEEIPNLLKILQCPYIPSKLALLNIGAKQNWAVALAGLDWLVTSINLIKNELQEDEDFFPDQNAALEKLINQYKLDIYETYMAGEDDLSPFFEDCRQKMLSMCNTEDFSADIEKVEVQVLELEEQVKKEQKEAEDLEKIENYTRQCVTFCERLKEMNKSYKSTQTFKEQEYAECVKQVEQIKNRIIILEQRISSQEMSVEDVENVMLDMQRQRRLVASLEQEDEKLDKEGYDLQIAQAKLHDQLDKLNGKSNRYLHRLPLDIQQEMGFDFTSNDEHIGNVHVDARTLQRVCRHVSESNGQLQKMFTENCNVSEQLEDQVVLQKQRKEFLDNQHRRQQQDIVFKKQERDHDLQAMQRRVDALEDEIANLRRGCSISLEQQECSIQALHVELAQMKRAIKEREEADLKFISLAAKMMLDHYQKQIEKFKFVSEIELPK